jgi:hypothetical protein
MFKKFIFIALFIALIILPFLSLEFYLHKTQGENINTRPKMSIRTHTGDKITEDGAITFALAPYTIYKNLPGQKAYITTNSKGLRCGEISDVSNKKTRIIVVGGSAAFGSSVANTETFASILESLDRSYEVINAGVVGFLSGQELVYIVTELVDYHPHIIIAFDGWNDLLLQWYYPNPKKKKRDELGYNTSFFYLQIEKKLIDNYNTQVNLFSSFGRFFNTVVDKSLILSWLKEKVEKFKQRVSYRQDFKKEGIENKPTDSDDYFNQILYSYTNNLKKMRDFCHSQNIKFIVVVQPELGLKVNKNAEEKELLANYKLRGVPYAKEYPALYKQFIERSKDILKKNGIDYIDINSNAEFINNRTTLFDDPVHTNKNGNDIIAKIIKDYLQNLQILGS